jgi:uncharacterized membrane protein YsdA (DUF1294 family)
MIHFDLSLTYFQIYLLIINSISFAIFGFDKIQALRENTNISRVRERTLLSVALIGGTLGGLFAMVLFRHKIKKVSFILRFLGIVGIQIFVGYYFYK